ncbi:MAG: cytochrome c biogenesis protein CcsA, partial [Saprospiraceae bacterium]|nr:cytochrome c biogenesis protein CcsA [Saprospiraceae bacterium]
SMIQGNGLNPLLQNYWMTIHPPTLFLGFASVAIPFSFAMAGLLTGKHREWLKPALPWALFSGGILGTGILMGGAWAYEALSFGGYWAWDPVENMSLVPWIILIAGIHGNLIARKTGYSLRTTYLFYALAFVLVLYSSFLTRSGVLGDSSAHAFTQMGLEWQLVFLMLFFGVGSAYLLIRRWRSIPVPEKEERIQSREFWMFIGTLVLLFSAVLITFTTSIPVYNKLLNVAGQVMGTDLTHLHRTAPVDPVPHYNKFQLWIAVFIALLSGIAQYLRYKEPSWKAYRGRFLRHIGIAVAATAVLTVLLSLWINAVAWQYAVLLACAAFAIVANSDYLISLARLQPRQMASGLAHLGFGLMLVGIMASGLNKEVISTNAFAQMGLIEGMDTRTHITLIKNRPMYMNGYWVEYLRDTIHGN